MSDNQKKTKDKKQNAKELKHPAEVSKPLVEASKPLVEALLFASSTGATVAEISDKLKIPEERCLKILGEIKKERDGQPIQVKLEGKKWKMLVREDLTPSLHGMVALPPEVDKSVVKTLAVIAYKSPVKQSDIIHIRGNKAYDHIKNLEEEGFIKLKPDGRTKEIKLSQRFYDYFQVSRGEEKYLFEQKAKSK
jgi:segregation and condensation protein B